MKVGVSCLRSSFSRVIRRQAAFRLNPGRCRLVGYGLFAALLFVALVSATFPYLDIISAVLAPMGLKLVSEEQRMNLPFGAQLKDVRLISADENLLLRSAEVRVSPSFARLLLGQLCLKIRAQIYGGEIDATVRPRARGISL